MNNIKKSFRIETFNHEIDDLCIDEKKNKKRNRIQSGNEIIKENGKANKYLEFY